MSIPPNLPERRADCPPETPPHHLGTLLLSFAQRHASTFLLNAAIGAAAGAVYAAQTLSIAPAIASALRASEPPARRLAELSLNNVGVTMAAWLGWRFEEERWRVVLLSVALYVAVSAVAGALRLVTSRLTVSLRVSLVADLQGRLLEQLLSQPLRFFRAHRMGGLTSRFISDIPIAARALDTLFTGLWEPGIQLLLFGVLLVWTDAFLAMLVGVALLLHVVLTRLLEHRLRFAMREATEVPASVGGRLGEILAGIRIVKLFAAETWERSRLAKLLAGTRDRTLRSSLLTDSEGPIREVMNALAGATAVVVAFGAIGDGRLTLSGFALFVFAARLAINPFSRMASAMLQLQAADGAFARVSELLSLAPPLRDGTIETPKLVNAIAIHDVGFRYGEEAAALERVSLEIPRGAIVALAGPSGAGKTTLADLILRLEDPASGTVTYDGVDVRQFSQTSYRSRFGVVPQEVFLFHASVTENIAYGRPVVEDKIRRAARIANAEEFIQRLPLAYDTVLGERGVGISGGERQRLAIARAVYDEPDVLILDEATAALDSVSERLVQEAMTRALEGTTALVIAHRLSSIARADIIAVMDRGRIVSVGRHDELLRSSPLYRGLWEAQTDDSAGGHGG